MPILVTVTGYDPVTGGLGTLRWADGKGYRTGPASTPANTAWEPRIIQGGNFERHLFGRARTRGPSTVGFGEVVINNADTALDHLKAWLFGGWPIKIERIVRTGIYPDDAEVVLYGTVGRVRFKRRQVIFDIRDRQAEISDKLLVEETYAGTNVLPDGLEGIAADIKGRNKPQPWGLVSNALLPMVNTSKLIFQVGVRAVQAIALTAMSDKGAALTPAADYATLADLLATSPSASQYRLFPGSATEGAYVRLGGTPSGQVTADITEGTNSTKRTTGQVLRRMMEAVGQAANNIVGDDVLDSFSSAGVGNWTELNGMRCGDALDAVAPSAAAYWIGDRQGRLAMGCLALPSGEPVFEFTTSNILDKGNALDVLTDENGGEPAYRVTVEWGHNWTIQTANELAGIALATQAYRSKEYRSVKYPLTDAEEAAVKAKSPNAVEITIRTQLALEVDALRLCAFLWARYATVRDVYEVPVASNLVTDVDLGDLVRITVPRFDLATGKLFRVLGEVVDLNRNVTTFIVWG